MFKWFNVHVVHAMLAKILPEAEATFYDVQTMTALLYSP